MPQDNDYFNQGVTVGNAYQAGQDAATKRVRDATDFANRSAVDAARARVATGAADDADYARGRSRNVDAGSAAAGDALLAGGSPATTGNYDPTSPAAPTGVADPSAPVAPVASAAPVTSAPATGVAPSGVGPAKPNVTLGDFHRLMAKTAFDNSGAEAGTAHLAAAKDADFQDAFNAGASSPAAHPVQAMTAANGTPGAPQSNPGAPNIAIGMVNSAKNPIGQKSVKDSHGKDSQYSITTIDPSGNGYSFMASESDMRAIAGYTAAMKVDPARALDGLGKIDGHLATLFATKLKQTTDMQQANTQTVAASEKGTYEGVMGDAKMILGNAAMIRAQAYEYKSEVANKDKPVPPDLLEKNNDLIGQLTEETQKPNPDPAKLKSLNTALNGVTTAISNAIGKPRMMPAPKEAKPVTETDVESYISDRSGQDKAFKNIPYDQKRAAAMGALSGGVATGGGLPAVDWSKPAQGGAATGAPVPAAPAPAPLATRYSAPTRPHAPVAPLVDMTTPPPYVRKPTAQ